jgi:DNA-binding winged helix-turn-helix (wHTH) protein/tetratricopeptide (TPR) repeat protein
MASRLFRFGNYLLDPARRELRLSGDIVDLPARAIHCIVHLIEHRERALSRDELIAAVWRNADISNNVLDQTMMRARRALGDLGDDRRAIRTIHGFGYAWAVPVDVIESAAFDTAERAASEIDVAASAATPSAETADNVASVEDAPAPADRDDRAIAQIPRWRHARPVSATAVAALLVGAVIFSWPATKPALPRKASAIVLPASVARGEQQAWMRLGLMDAIAERLRASGHTVMPVDNVVAVTAGTANPTERQLVTLLDSDAGRVLIRPAVERIEGNRWRVSLEVRRGSSFAPGETGEAADVLTAARIAADRFSASFGITPRQDSGEAPEKLALQQELQIVDAARLDSRIDDARALLDMLTPAQQNEPEAALMRGLVDLADGHFAEAGVVFEHILSEPALRSSASVTSRALYGKGVVLFHLSQSAEAVATFDKAVALLERDRTDSDGDWLGRILGARAIARVLLGDAQGALADQARARLLFESAGDALRLGVLDNNIGWTSLQRNRFREALPVLERAAAASVPLNTISVELRARVGIVRAQLALLDPQPALAEDARIEELIARSPGATVQHLATGWRIRSLLANGRLHAADSLIESLRGSQDRKDEEQFVPWAFGLAAQRAYSDGRADDAAALAAQSLARDWGADYDAREYARTLLVLLRAQLALGQRDAAAATLASARTWKPPDRLSETAAIYGAVLVAEAQAAGIEQGEARATYEHALELADANQTPLDLLQVCHSYADYLIASGDLAYAAQVVGRVGEWSTRDFEVAALEAGLYQASGDMAGWKSAAARANALAGERKPLTGRDEIRLGAGPSASAGRSLQALR